MKIWSLELEARLDSCHVRSDKTFNIMDVAIFDFTLVTVAMVTGKENGIYSRCTFIHTVLQTQLYAAVWTGHFKTHL